MKIIDKNKFAKRLKELKKGQNKYKDVDRILYYQKLLFIFEIL